MMDGSHLLLQSVIVPIIFAPIVLALGRRLGGKVGWITSLPLLFGFGVRRLLREAGARGGV